MPDPIGIVGTDGYTPIYQPDDRWNMWSLHEIYTGAAGQNKYIPKVNDYVLEPETGTTYIVTDLNNVTFIPELTEIAFNSSVSSDSLISSTGDNYRIYFDKSIVPYTLSVDGLLRVYSNTAMTAKIYQGTFIDPTKIVSRTYDNNGNFLGHDVSLELVAYNTHDNYAIKSVPTCNTDTDLQDGETCIVVIYDADGKVISKVSCIVEETTYVAQAFAEQKYITQIYIKSAFIDNSQPDVIHYPVNLPIASFNPIGVVQYNDGSTVEYPIDGDKFRIYGLDSFLSTIIGHRVPIVINYRLDSNEAALASVDSDNYYVTRPYTLIVDSPNTSYNVKLFVYPVWVDDTNGYTYKAFLMNLDRNVLFDVTSDISLSSNSPSFNPLAYGLTQRLTFNVDLANVSGIYHSFIHSQTVDIILRGAASDTSVTNIWEVASQVPSNVPLYGTDLRAIRDQINTNKVRIDNNINTVAEFIDKLYITTSPLFNPILEQEPLTPSHIEVKYGTENVIVPIDQYTNDFTFSVSVQMLSNIDIVFLKEVNSGFLKLSIASLTVR
jgi:hypothetical protein